MKKITILKRKRAVFWRFRSGRYRILTKRDEFDELLSTFTKEDRKTKQLDRQDFLDNFDASQIAQQLCFHNYEIFKKIHPIEFLNEIWKKDNDSSPSFKFFCERFDKESYWCATELVSNQIAQRGQKGINAAQELKTRVKLLSKFISVANVCVSDVGSHSEEQFLFRICNHFWTQFNTRPTSEKDLGSII